MTRESVWAGRDAGHLSSPLLLPKLPFLFPGHVGTEKKRIMIRSSKDFPGGPVVKTPRFQCRGRGFDPWSGELRSHVPCGVAKKKKKKFNLPCKKPCLAILNNF